MAHVVVLHWPADFAGQAPPDGADHLVVRDYDQVEHIVLAPLGVLLVLEHIPGVDLEALDGVVAPAEDVDVQHLEAAANALQVADLRAGLG